MKTSFGCYHGACRHGSRPWILLAIMAGLALVSARQACGEDTASVLARGASLAGYNGPLHDEPANSFIDGPAPASQDAYGGEWNPGMSWDGGMGWECDAGCPPTCRGRAEGLWFTRNHAGDSFTNFFTFDNNFDYAQGIRATLDGRWDCTHGWEVSFAGLINWQQETFATGLGTLNSIYTAGPGVDLSAFQGANAQTQRYDSDLNSLETLYKCWGWDVISVGWGGRYVNLQEQFLFRSVDSNGDIGLVRSDANNNLVMGEVELDMYFPIGRWSFDSTCKLALGTNIGDNLVFVSNAGSPLINHKDRDIEFAGMIEGATFWRYFVTPRLAIRGGYEFWYMCGLGLANRQLDTTVTFQSGRDFRAKDEILVHGASLGIEFGW